MRKLSLILAIMLLASCLSCACTGVAFASTETIYTGVLEDLQKDETFDAAAYPTKTELSENDKVMDVIQIAESNAGELFLYVYQPQAGKFTATEARISQTVGDDVAPDDYKLTLLDRNGALEKYKVENYSVSSEADRIYYIIQLARPWDKDIDEPTGNDNKESTVPYPVAKQFRAETVDGNIQYTEAHEDVITLTAKYCGKIRNFAGWIGVASQNTDSHFIAFDTDVRMDKLMEATVTYDYIGYSETVVTLTGVTMPGTYKEYPESKVTGKKANLKAEKEIQTPTVGLFGKEYSWNEIQSVEEFLNYEEVTDDVRKQVEGKQWVLRFALTDVVDHYGGAGVLPPTFERAAFLVTDASVLSLKFIRNGKTYNLGVVDNKQTEPVRPSNPTPDSNLEESIKSIMDVLDQIGKVFDAIGKFFTEYWWVGVIIAAVTVLGILAAIFKPFASGLKILFKALGKGIWFLLKWVVLLPFTLIYYGIKGAKNKKGVK